MACRQRNAKTRDRRASRVKMAKHHKDPGHNEQSWRLLQLYMGV